jgi:hypothetical protein
VKKIRRCTGVYRTSDLNGLRVWRIEDGELIINHR